MAEENSDASNATNTKIGIAFLWILSLVAAGWVGFAYGQGHQAKAADAVKDGSAANISQLTTTDTPAPQLQVPQSADTSDIATAPTVDATVCSKTGYAQKWEYLASYTVKENDTVQNIATTELHDGSRVNEILQINGVGPLVVGSTLYLPPPSVTKSSGNLKEVYGKLVEKNVTSWHVSFSNDPKGQGILIPGFLFEGVQNSDSFKVGDCIKVFFDDGYKVFSVNLQ